MMSRVAIVLIFFSMVAFQAMAQSNKDKFPKISVDDFHVQGIDWRRGESGGDDQQDLEFDRSFTKVDRPELPNVEQVTQMFDYQYFTLSLEAHQAGDDHLFYDYDVRVLGDFKFHDLQSWMSGILKYCPREYKYQCMSKDFKLSCMYHYYKDLYGNKDEPGHWEWCCPFFPEIVVQQCACCQCAVLTSQYALMGRCRRRYKWTGFLAVCNRDGAWSYLRYIKKKLPSSCYCRIERV